MKALPYLLFVRLKNRIKDIFRSPAKLIYSLILLALLGFVIFSANLSGGEAQQARSGAELRAILLALFTFLFLFSARSGFSTGLSIFSMPDVNFLFAGPFRPVRVLFYGTLQQMGTSLLVSAVLLFQYAWLHDLYAVTLGKLLVILLGYAVTVFTSQLTAMSIYSLTAGSARRRNLTLAVFVAVPALYALFLFLAAARSPLGPLAALVEASASPAVRLFPVSGWLACATACLIGGEYLAALPLLLLWAAYCAVLFFLLGRRGQDYYEDVLQSTETAFLNAAAAKAGRVNESAPRKIRRGRVGLGGGQGASAFWYKHRVENRRSRVFLLSGAELVIILVSVAFAFFMRGSGGLIAAVSFAEYMQVFSVGLGRLLKEMTKPYVYLVPEPPFRKLLWCLRESLPSFALAAAAVFLPVGLMMGLNAAEIFACMLLHLSFSYLFTAGNLVTERVFGRVNTKALIFLFYFLVLLLAALPGIAAAILLSVRSVRFLSAVFTVSLGMSLANGLMALLAFFLCRNILSYAELNQ